MRTIAIAVLAAGLFATPAFAQDAAPPPVRDFSGFRIEGLLGYDNTRVLGNDDGGLLYGVGVGYDIQSGRAVFGVEAEASDATTHGCITNLVTPADRGCANLSRDLYVGGRIGARVGRNLLIYGKAGYTNMRFVSTYDDGTPAGASNTRLIGHLDGIRVGLGAEFGIGRHAYVRTEARYSNYEDGSDRGAGTIAFGFRF
jgi:outer membrane immunogenic protein